ncbi:hypothetical protein ACQJ0H_09790 [Pantoea agglomerans]|uniref:hypothetical protein n=1 Tax=Enterobacter agglomerans TaxID=549 RepID=UPI003CEEBEC2
MSLTSIIIFSVFIFLILAPVLLNCRFWRDVWKILKYNPSPTKKQLKKNGLLFDESGNKKNYDAIAFSAEHLQAHAQKIIFICLSLLLITKGLIEILDTLNMFEKVEVTHMVYYWTVDNFKLGELHWSEYTDKWPLVAHIRHIKTLTYVANALAISCGLQLAYMLITEGPDEAIEPIMLGVASVILLILSTVEPSQWNIYNSISIIMLILGIFLLHYISGKIREKQNIKKSNP